MSSPKLPALYDVAIYAKGRCDRAHHDLLPLSDNFEIWAGEEAKARRYESMVVGNEKGNEKGCVKGSCWCRDTLFDGPACVARSRTGGDVE